MASAVYSPTASQFASAAMHLERRSEWRTVRIDGVRYISLISGRSNRVYLVRADAAGCGCVWSQTMSSPCSHRIAVDLAAMEDDLSEDRDPMADLFTRCARVGCGAICEGRLCDECAAMAERSDRMATAIHLGGRELLSALEVCCR